jgi:hypothetical protein
VPWISCCARGSRTARCGRRCSSGSRALRGYRGRWRRSASAPAPTPAAPPPSRYFWHVAYTVSDLGQQRRAVVGLCFSTPAMAYLLRSTVASRRGHSAAATYQSDPRIQYRVRKPHDVRLALQAERGHRGEATALQVEASEQRAAAGAASAAVAWLRRLLADREAEVAALREVGAHAKVRNRCFHTCDAARALRA